MLNYYLFLLFLFIGYTKLRINKRGGIMKKYNLILISLVFFTCKSFDDDLLNPYDKQVKLFLCDKGAITLVAVKKNLPIDEKLEKYPLLDPLRSLFSCYNRDRPTIAPIVIREIERDAGRLEVALTLSN